MRLLTMGVRAERLVVLSKIAVLACCVISACAPQAQPGSKGPSLEVASPAEHAANLALPSAAPDVQVAQLKTKSDLPPVIPTLGGNGGALDLPAILPPGPTDVRPPQPVFLLSGSISGLAVRKVQAVSLAGGRDHAADVRAADNTFAFANIDPWYYQLALVGPDATLLVRKVILIEPAKPVFIRIEVQAGGTRAKVDDLPVPVEIR